MQVDAGDARLSCQLDGEGPLVICLHGFPDVFSTFREQVPVLVAAGFRVAVPAMRGYPPSSVSYSGRYDAPALAADVLAIAEALSPHEPVRLFGHDWGAVAAQAACALAPDRFSALATAAVPPVEIGAFLSPAQLRRSWYMALFQLPGVAERALLRRHGALIEHLWRSWSPGYSCPPEHMKEVIAAVRAHPSDVLGYYRALPQTLSSPLLRRRHAVPWVHLHGLQDGCIGVELAEAAADRCEVELLPGGHFVHLESPTQVGRILRRHFTA